MARLGWAALLCYAIHGGYHLLHGRPEDLLWACHLGAVLVGVGLLLSAPAVNGIGTLFLCLGLPLWLLDLAGGGVFHPTSCLTHVGGLAVGLYGVRRLGMPGGTWWRATAVLAALILVFLLATPARANVNVAFAVQPGWEGVFPSHPVYLAIMMSLAAGTFFVVAWVLRRWLVAGPAREAGP